MAINPDSIPLVYKVLGKAEKKDQPQATRPSTTCQNINAITKQRLEFIYRDQMKRKFYKNKLSQTEDF